MAAIDNIAGIVHEQARSRPATPAIIDGERIVTYGQLRVAVGIVARHLRRQGVEAGQVIGISFGQNTMHVVAMLALAQIGAVSMPLHCLVPVERRVLAARRFGAIAVVAGKSDYALPGLRFVSLASLAFDGIAVPPDHEMHPVEDDTPCRIALSSGTSGDPKGVMLTHGLMDARSRRPEAGFGPGSRMIPMDLAFVSGFATAFRAFAAGATLVLPANPHPEQLLRTIVSERVTHMLLSPTQARALADHATEAGPCCATVANMKVVGGPLAPALFQLLREKLTPHVHVGYGATESGSVAAATPELLARKPGCVGRVQPWAEVVVVDAEGRPLPAGETGLLRIRSSHQAAGYLGDAASRDSFRDGWFECGDLGRFDEEGVLFIEGRAGEALNVGGLKVNPAEIDAVLAAHPAVADAGAFVLAPVEGREQIAAAVVTRPGHGGEDIGDYCRARLGPLAPARLFAVEALPRTVTGKLRRADLSARFSQEPSPAPIPLADSMDARDNPLAVPGRVDR